MKYQIILLFLLLSGCFCFSDELFAFSGEYSQFVKRDEKINEFLDENEDNLNGGQICQPGKLVENFPFYIYQDADYPGNHYFPSGYMGDYVDIKFDLFCKDNPYSGSTCIKMTYSGKAYQGGKWAGLYWQSQTSDWGKELGGYNLEKATKFTFWARGQRGGEMITVFKIGGIVGEYGDFSSKTIGPAVLTKKWKKYTIDLKHMDLQMKESCPNSNPLSRVVGGFAWVTNIDVNQGGIVFYLDEMKYEVE